MQSTNTNKGDDGIYDTTIAENCSTSLNLFFGGGEAEDIPCTETRKQGFDLVAVF